jgi:hypothetical protein
MRRILLLPFLLALALFGSTTPALAAGNYGDTTLTLTTQDLQLWPSHCGTAAYSVSGPALQAYRWDVSVTVTDPYGVHADFAYFYDGAGVTADSVYLCADYDRQGTYTVQADYETYDSSYTTTSRGTVTGSFTFSTIAKAGSSLSVTRTAYRAHSWKIRGRLTKDGAPWAGHPVTIQAYAAGAWRPIKTKYTNASGYAVWTATPRAGAGKIRVRLHSNGGDYVNDANSRVFRLPKR